MEKLEKMKMVLDIRSRFRDKNMMIRYSSDEAAGFEGNMTYEKVKNQNKTHFIDVKSIYDALMIPEDIPDDILAPLPTGKEHLLSKPITIVAKRKKKKKTKKKGRR